MTAWTLTFSAQDLFLDFAVVSLLLVMGTLGRRYIPFLQRYLIPNCLVAGFLGLCFGPELLGWLPFEGGRMGMYVYHLLAIMFIAVGLRGSATRTRAAVHVGFVQILVFLLQALIGLTLALLLVYWLQPDLYPAVGLLLTLGFGMGPGVAYAIGQSWESYGFEGAGSIGLALAAIGFLVAYGTGMMIVNSGIRRGDTELLSSPQAMDPEIRTGIVSTEPVCGGKRTTFSGAIDVLTLHIAFVGMIYLFTFVVVQTAASAFTAWGLGAQVPTLWSFHFIAANLLALGVRRILNSRGSDRILDAGLLNRITGLTADYLIASSIMAISVQVVWTYALPIALLVLVGTPLTYFVVKWATERTFTDYPFERFIGLYGEMTGTLTSGLALVRVTDPEYETPVAQDLALGSGVALTLGFPLLLVLNWPFTWFKGELIGYAVVMGICVVYLVCLLWVWTRFGLKLRA